MERLVAACFCILHAIAGQGFCAGQRPATKEPGGALRESSPAPIDLHFSNVEPLTGLPDSTAIAYPQVCSSDGTIFSQIYASTEKPELANLPEVYSVSETREVQRHHVTLPQGYKSMSLRSLYASRNSIVYLIHATQPTVPDSSLPRGKVVAFLSVSNRNGGESQLIRVDAKILPLRAAISDEGTMFVLGIGQANLDPVLATLNPDGSIARILNTDLGNTSFAGGTQKDSKPNPATTETIRRQRAATASLSQAQFVPWGHEILLVAAGTTAPVYRLGDGGVKDKVSVKPPPGFLLKLILGSDVGDTWVALFAHSGSFEKSASGQVVENVPSILEEIDPFTGVLIRRLQVEGPMPDEVICAAHHKLAAIYYGLPAQQNLPDRLTYASVFR